MHVCFHSKLGPWYAHHQVLSTLVWLDCLQLYSSMCKRKVGPSHPGLDIEPSPSLTFAEEEVILAIHFPNNSSLLFLHEPFSE